MGHILLVLSVHLKNRLTIEGVAKQVVQHVFIMVIDRKYPPLVGDQ